MKRLVTTTLALVTCALTLGGAGALSSGCGDTTGQQHVSFAARAGGFEHPDGPVRFTTSTGWSVTLTTARVAVGPVYLNTITPLACDGCAMSLLQKLSDVLAPRAWAHGASHLGGGQFVGQVTHQVEVDVLSSRLVDMPGGGDGVDLPVRSAELWLYNRDGALRGAAIRVAGVASRDVDGAVMEVPFSGALVMDESITNAQTPLDLARRVRGVPTEIVLSEGGALTVRVDPRTWFQGADFSELNATPAGADGTHGFSTSDNVGRAFVNATRASRGVFSITFTPGR